MKKLFLLLCAISLFQAKSFSQCVPDPNSGQAYLHPAELAFAMAGVYYSQVLTVRVPSDSDIVYNGIPVHATVDSAQLLYIGGIPAGYGYVCNNARCTWNGGSKGCALLSGVSDTAGSKVGEYPIKVYVGTWAKAAATSFYRIDSSSSYTFKVVAYTGQFEIVKTEPLKVYPNPSNGTFKIELRDIQSDNNQLLVMDASGRIVFEKTFEKPGQFLNTEEVKLNDYAKGLYIVTLRSGDRLMQNKVLVR